MSKASATVRMLELIEKFGADGVRVGMLLPLLVTMRPYDDSLCEQGPQLQQ